MEQSIVFHRGTKPFIECTEPGMELYFSNPIIINLKKGGKVKINVCKIISHNGSIFIGEKYLGSSIKEEQAKEIDFLLKDYGFSKYKRNKMLALFNSL